MKSRSLLVAAALSLTTLGLSQSDSPKITYTTVAAPIGTALSEISKQAGIRLSVSPQVANEVIVLSLKNVPLDDVKTQIAKACSAKWEEIQGGEMLIPDLVLRRQEEQKEKAEYTAQIQKSLKEMVEALNPPKRDPKQKVDEEELEMEEMMMFQFRGASSKASILLANAIGATNLASIDAKSRVVYSTNPTRMQRQLPGNYNQILGQLVTEHNAEVAKVLKDKANNPREENAMEKRMREMFGDFGDFEAKPIEGTPSKAILVCTRQRMFGGLNLNLLVFNEKGAVVIRGTQMIRAGDSMFGGMDLGDLEFGEDGLPKAKPQTKAEAGEKPIAYSETTKELLELGNVMTMASNTKPMSEELKMKLLNPEQYDPLSFAHSEALVATAAQRGKPLVAVLPDGMDSFMGMFRASTGEMTPSAYLQSIRSAANVSAEGPFILVRPTEPAKSRRERIDRGALGLFLRAAEAKGTVFLDDLATYAQKSNSPMEDSLAMRYFMIFAPTAIQSGMGGQVSWDMLRFYGGLSTLQKKNMDEGGRLGFNQLSPVQAAALRQMAFGPETALVVEDPTAKKSEFEFPSFIRSAIMGAMVNDYRNEPTELMPNGLPSNGYVELKLTNDRVAKPTGNVQAMLGNAVLGADELAILKMFKDMPGMEQMAGMMPVIDEVRLGERTVYDFKFHFAPSVTMDKSLNDDRISSSSPIVKMTNLPAEFAKKIEDRLAAFKKMPFFDPSFFQGSGTTPPP